MFGKKKKNDLPNNKVLGKILLLYDGWDCEGGYTSTKLTAEEYIRKHWKEIED